MSYCMMSLNYGPLKKGRSYSVLKEGRDWLAIKARGKVFYVNKNFIVDDPISEMYNLKREINDVVDNDDLDLF
ncbi:MAG: hypothetical protein GTO02_10185 [Candidatus Dadabacteria bacterium]|nr:hypothetical protein [Candidatus Dadabacteria bacterium]